MSDFIVHDVPPADLSALTARARRHGRSPEEEVRQLIHEAAQQEVLLRDLDRVSEAMEGARQQAQAATGPHPTARRYRRVEPTPRRPVTPR